MNTDKTALDVYHLLYNFILSHIRFCIFQSSVLVGCFAILYADENFYQKKLLIK